MFLGYLRMLWSKVSKLPSQKLLVLQPVANLNMLLETLVQYDRSFHGQYIYKAMSQGKWSLPISIVQINIDYI